MPGQRRRPEIGSPVSSTTSAKRPYSCDGAYEVRLAPARGRRRHRAAVELVHPGGRRSRRAGGPRRARRPRSTGSRAARGRARGRAAPRSRPSRGAAAARPRGTATRSRTSPGRPHERLRQAGRVEPPPDRARVAGLLREHRRAERLEPRERVVELLHHDALQRRVAVGAVLAEPVERPVPEDDARREQHRAAGAVALLVDDDVEPELAGPGGGRETGHAGAGHDQHAA